MKQRYVILFSVLLCSMSSVAQQFRWLTGGGSTCILNNGGVKGEWITHMCTDDKGNVYSLAQVGDINIKADTFSQSAFSTSNDSWHILFISHDCNGNMRFAKLIESKSNNTCDGIAYSNGHIYVGGTLYNTDKRIGYDATLTGIYNSTFTSKFDTSGAYVWTQFIGPDEYSTVQSSGIGDLAIDGQGNIHRFVTVKSGLKITQTLTSTWGSYDLKYSPNGTLIDVNKLQDIDSGYHVLVAKIDKSSNKSYVLFGYRGGTTTRSYNALLAYNPNGTMIWKDTTNVRNSINNLRIDPGNNIYFVGSGSLPYPFSIKGMTVNNSIATNGTGSMAIIGKLDIQTGNPIWIYHMDGLNAVNGFNDLELLPDNTITAFGYYVGFKKYKADTLSSPMGSNYRPYIFSIDNNGALIDWEYMEGTDFYNYGLKITSDKKGNVYVGGEVPKDIKAGKLPQYSSNGGNSDFYIAKFGYDCNCTNLAIPNSNFSFAITDTLKKEVQFTFLGTSPHDSVVWRFGDASVLTSLSPKHVFPDTGWYTVCAKVMVPCGRKVFCKDVYVPYKDTSTTDTGNSVVVISELSNVKIYPNPVSDVLHIDGLEPGSRIELYDIVGHKVHMITTAGEKEVININDLPQGNYFVEITLADGARVIGKVLKK